MLAALGSQPTICLEPVVLITLCYDTELVGNHAIKEQMGLMELAKEQIF